MIRGAKRISPRPRIAIWLVPIGVLIFIGANAHLFYLAVTTQPSCVDHLRAPAPGSGQYRAAKSTC